MVVCAGLIGTIGYNLNAGILNGLGNSRTTLLFLAIASVLNIILDLTLVLWCHLDVLGVAIGTIVSQAFSWIFGVYYINRHYPQIAIHPFNRKFDRALFKQIMTIGLPAGIQMSLIAVGSMVVMSKVNTFGQEFTAGFNVGNKLDSLAFLPAQSLAAAVTAYVGQNVGAKKWERVRAGIRIAVILSGAWSLLMTALLMPFGENLMRVFSSSPDVIRSGAVYLHCIMPFYILFVTMFTLNAAMRGAGDSLFPMINVVLSLILVRVPALYLLANHLGSDYMYYGYGIGWVIGFAITGIYYCTGRWKRYGLLTERPQTAE
jgi:putative MATE family efflux protein